MSKILVTGVLIHRFSTCKTITCKGLFCESYRFFEMGGESLFDVMTHNNFELYKGDLRNINDIKKATENIDSVVHLAAIVGDPACSKYSNEANETNWTASVNLFKECEKNKLKDSYSLLLSNYGKMSDSNGYVNETYTNPVSLMELVKFENFLLNENKNSSVVSTALRFSTVYGFSPRIRFDESNEFTRNMAVENFQEIWGEQFWRPYAHVDDLCRATILVLE